MSEPVPWSTNTQYAVTGLPLSVDGASHVTFAELGPGVATTFLGADGAPMSTAWEKREGGLSPRAFRATTRKRTLLPLASPVKVVLVVAPPTVTDPTVTKLRKAVTVYRETGAPFVVVGAVQRTVAIRFPAVAETDRGCAGAPTVIGGVVVDAGPRPLMFCAAMVKV
jgi:hypothetical protein